MAAAAGVRCARVRVAERVSTPTSALNMPDSQATAACNSSTRMRPLSSLSSSARNLSSATKLDSGADVATHWVSGTFTASLSWANVSTRTWVLPPKRR
jgi:hypothetical protein